MIVSRQDVDQEVALLELQGKTAKRSLIVKRLAGRMDSFDEAPQDARPLFMEDPITDPETTGQLIDWAFTQSAEVAEATFDFLEFPTDKGLDELLVILQGQGITIAKIKVAKERSLTQFLKDQLKKGSRTIDQLNEVARQFYPSHRPEAAVRQVLRRFTRQGIVSINHNLVTLKG